MKTKLAFKTREGKADVIGFYETLLGHWMKPNEQFYIQTRFGDAYVIACGEKDAPPLLLLHGSAMNSVMWLGGQLCGHITGRVAGRQVRLELSG